MPADVGQVRGPAERVQIATITMTASMVLLQKQPTVLLCHTATVQQQRNNSLTMEQSERYKRQYYSNNSSGGGNFDEFPPTMQQTRQPQPTSSRIRFAEDTKIDDMTNNINQRNNNKRGKNRQVLVLGGGSSGGDDISSSGLEKGSQQMTRIRAKPYDHNSIISSASSATPPAEREPSNTLDFSMIATPGGKRLARVVMNDETASESSSHFTTPFTNMLRGVVSSTPGMLSSVNDATSTAAASSVQYSNVKSSSNHHVSEEEECTALTFAKSAPHSGYLKKLGKNIHTFKRRFFVLKPSTHLYYFISPNDVEPRGCIDLDNFVQGSGNGNGGCHVNEIGVLPDGTFRFELVFDEESQDVNDAILNDDDVVDDNGNGNNKNSIVLEARTEEIGREWISKIKSERLSVARGQVEQLQTSLAKSEAACSEWEEMALAEKRRANDAEASRNVAIAEAKSWEGRFRDLNEAIRLLVRDTAKTTATEDASSSTLEFLRESLQGLELNGTNFEDVSEAFQRIRDDHNEAVKKKEYANESIFKLQQRLEETEARAKKAEDSIVQVREESLAMKNELKRVKREKKVLVKEVKSLHENRRQQENENSENQLQKGGTGYSSSIKSNEDQKRLIIELEEHVMSGLRLSEQFLALNGIDVSEVGDDLDSSFLTSSKASDVSPLRRRRRIPAVIGAQSEVIGNDDLDSIQASSKTSDMSPLRQMQNKQYVQPETHLSPNNHPSMQDTRQMSNLLDDDNDDDEEESFASEVSSSQPFTDDGLTRMSEASYPDRPPVAEKSINQNLNDIFAEEPHINKFEEEAMPSSNDSNTTNDASRSLVPVASFQSSETARSSKITDNDHATAKLIKAPQDATMLSTSTTPATDDRGVYHITFYRKRLGLQFQKVPNEMGSTTGLLTNVIMTADGLDAPETTTTELQRIASMSQHSRSRGRSTEDTEILPVSPVDAVIVCGFIGFDDSSGSIRPKVGARLVAFDGIPVEVGRWTFESIRKAIQARSRPLTLSFRNDILSPKQQAILKKALDDIAAVSPPPQSIPANLQYPLPKTGSQGETYLDEETLAAASSASSTTSSQRSRFNKKHYSFSETGSSISSAVAPLVSNLMKKSTKQKQQHLQQMQRQQHAEPEYLRRQSSSHDQMRLHEFRSSML